MTREIPGTDPVKAAADLRSQLHQMAAASQILEQTAQSEKARSYLAVMNQSICRMLRIVSRMALSHRLSRGETTLSPKYQDLAPALDAFGARLQGVLGDIGVIFSFSCPTVLPANADFELLQQMLLELVSHLALAGTDISLTVTQNDKLVCFTLSDKGPGTAEGRPALPSVLEEQEEQSSLELARQIAELHGGTLVISPGHNQSMSVAASIPVGETPSGTLKSPIPPWDTGGFDPVLVGLSALLPARSFLTENLG